jgi:hypothetical protein
MSQKDEKLKTLLQELFQPDLDFGLYRVMHAKSADVKYKIGHKIGTDTITVTIRGAHGHARACHGLPEPLYPATRIM